jgi:hypothetical protein
MKKDPFCPAEEIKRLLLTLSFTAFGHLAQFYKKASI